MNRLIVGLLTMMMVILHARVTAHSYHVHTPPPTRHFSAQHRFPHLQRVQARLDTPDAATPPPSVRSSLRSAGEHPKSSEDDYDDDDQDIFDDEDEDDDDDLEEEHQSYQPHSESGRPPWQTENSHHENTPPMSAHSQFKWTTFGRRPALDEYRNSRLSPAKKRPQSADDTQEALQHALRVNRESICKVPRAKVIHVKDVYPHPSKTYVPHCTVLHQCGDDTGCCRTETHACVARRTHRVELYFYSTTHGSGSTTDLGARYRQPYTGGSVVEKLVFYNHTECACEDKHADLMPRDMEPQRGHLMTETHFRPSHTRLHEPAPRSSGCRCPGDFSPRVLEDGSCKCECFDKQRDCLRLKRGKDYFTHQDRLCIEKKQCQVPVCEFGSYMRLSGRCTRKQEKFATWQGYSPRHDFR